MVNRVVIRSRAGNLTLAAVGALYAVAAVAVLAWFLVHDWGSSSTIDRVMQLGLFGCAIASGWLANSAAKNLGGAQRRTAS